MSSAEGLGANIIHTSTYPQCPLRAWFIANTTPTVLQSNLVLQTAECLGNQIDNSAGAGLVFAISEVATSNSISFHFSAILQFWYSDLNAVVLSVSATGELSLQLSEKSIGLFLL